MDSAHYERDLVKVNGQGLFSKRKIYNEQRAEWAYKGAIPPGNDRPTDVIAVRASGPPLDGLPVMLVY
jgi:hypothetical protein